MVATVPPDLAVERLVIYNGEKVIKYKTGVLILTATFI
jgi:hypothetical protein